MAGWDELEKNIKEGGGGKFTRLKNDGDRIVGIFSGEGEFEEKYWDEKEKKFLPYTEELRAKGAKVNSSYTFNFLIIGRGDAANAPKDCPPEPTILQLNRAGAANVIRARNKYGLDSWIYEVQRVGKERDQKLTYTLAPEIALGKIEDIKDEAKRATYIAWVAGTHETLKRFDLKKEMSRDDGEDGAGAGSDAAASSTPVSPTDEIGTDSTEYKLIKERAGSISRAMLDELFAKFGGVKKLSALKKADMKDVFAWLDAKTAPPPANGAAAQQVQTNDPFG